VQSQQKRAPQQEATKAYRIGFVGLPSAGSLPERSEAFCAGLSSKVLVFPLGCLFLSCFRRVQTWFRESGPLDARPPAASYASDGRHMAAAGA